MLLPEGTNGSGFVGLSGGGEERLDLSGFGFETGGGGRGGKGVPSENGVIRKRSVMIHYLNQLPEEFVFALQMKMQCELQAGFQ